MAKIQHAEQATEQSEAESDTAKPAPIALAEHEMECPVCGHTMPDLRGGKATICTVCGFKDSCCF